MSLINEALKRAKQVHDRQPRVAPSDAPLQPVADAPSVLTNREWMTLGISLFLVVSAVCCLALWWRTPRVIASAPPTPPQTSVKVAQAPALPKLPVESKLTAQPKPTPVTQPMALPTVTSNIAAQARQLPALPLTNAPTLASAQPSTHVKAAAASAASKQTNRISAAPKVASVGHTNRLELSPPEVEQVLAGLRLQGIFYRRTRASVLINGQTLFVGDEIDRAKVVGIDRYAVHVQIGTANAALRLK